jgi:singapore isolate B (sub-type 7) whole genome shotgun sequence assembly, scaffold_0
LDTWSENEIKAMKMGGNKQMIDFFEKHNIPSEVPVSVKYTTETATLYRSMYWI